MWLVDINNDFILPGAPLEVPGAVADGNITAEFIRNHIRDIDGILGSTDSHYEMHVAHGIYWYDQNGDPIKPYVTITLEMLLSGEARPFHSSLMPWLTEYLALGPIIIWPPHCIIGTEGAAIYKPVRDAMSEWEISRKRTPVITPKGSFRDSEHFGALAAAKEHPGDPTTGMNYQLVKATKKYDKIIFAGQALNCCVVTTVEQFVENFTKDELKKIYICKDMCSAVDAPGLKTYDETLDHLETLGVTITDSENVMSLA